MPKKNMSKDELLDWAMKKLKELNDVYGNPEWTTTELDILYSYLNKEK